MRNRPTLTRRGWATLTVGVMLLGFAIGLLLSPGGDPCDWPATVGVECAP